ncbi:MAG: leucyl/phenylalanyl-tRNA--protein transferase [Flavobacterium sp. BFFFF2]|nr:MAG: leucyl/phenylalanyl-tRNA--protein transferase [Flavobacterium sp. BFFFF2]
MFQLSVHHTQFPPVDWASEEGILAFGGDLSIERLEQAYHLGIFPWYELDEPILWWAPPRRMVVDIQQYYPSKTLRNLWRKQEFTLTFNAQFEQVIRNCQKAVRPGQYGTWITEDIIKAYTIWHQQGRAKSVECWQNGQLVGGLYGIDLEGVFCGESMFSAVSNASKFAFLGLIEHLRKSNYVLLDCQVHNPYLEQLGAFEISRENFLKLLKAAAHSVPSGM